MRYSCVRPTAGARLALATALFSVLPLVAAADTLIPLKPRADLDTFYVDIGVSGTHSEEYLVDTGAGYMTITSETLERLQRAGDATYLRPLDGRLADGSVLRVAVYRLSEITIGSACTLRNVEVAVLPGASRGLFGLSALRKASPFEFSVDPPTLRLSNCNLGNTLAAD